MKFLRCRLTVNVLWFFLLVPWVGLRCVIVVLSDYAYLLFFSKGLLGRRYLKMNDQS